MIKFTLWTLGQSSLAGRAASFPSARETLRAASRRERLGVGASESSSIHARVDAELAEDVRGIDVEADRPAFHFHVANRLGTAVKKALAPDVPREAEKLREVLRAPQDGIATLPAKARDGAKMLRSSASVKASTSRSTTSAPIQGMSASTMSAPSTPLPSALMPVRIDVPMPSS